MPRLRRGSWRPGQAPTGTALFVVQCGVLFQCAVRGLDYLRPDTDVTSVLSKVQDSAPLAAWGMFFVVAALVATVGILGRWGPLVAVGHIMAMVAYAGIGYGLFQVTGFGPGVRTPTGMAVTAIIHGAIGVGIFATLRRREMIAALPLEGT